MANIGRSGPFLPVLLVFAKGQLDIIQQVVVGRALAELVGRAVFRHEAVQLVSLQVSHLQDYGAVEPVIDELILLFVHQPVLEGLQPVRPLKPEHVDQLVQVYARPESRIAVGDLESRLVEIEVLFVVFPVLQAIHVIIVRHYPYFL